MIRYYSNIVGKYGSPVQKALGKLQDVNISVIASTHGPVWTDPKYIERVVSIYNDLSLYNTKEGVVIIYGTMYGNTQLMAEAIAAELAEQGIKEIIIHNANISDPSYIIADVFKYKGLIVGSPTYNGQLYPKIEAIISDILLRDIKNRYLGYFGSSSWAGVSVKRLGDFATKSKFEIIADAVDMKHSMKEINYEQCINLARGMANRLKKDRA